MVELGQQAYVTLILHALKYPSAAVNGVLLGTVTSAGVSATHAVPLLHQQLSLAPMLEIAMGQVRTKRCVIDVIQCTVEECDM